MEIPNLEIAFLVTSKYIKLILVEQVLSLKANVFSSILFCAVLNEKTTTNQIDSNQFNRKKIP